jgi:cell wall assembly regulator SMI1
MPGWLPIFANGGGDFYVIDLSGAGVVRHFRIEEAEHPIEFLTVSDMLATIAAGHDRGLFFVDDNGYLEMDDLVFGSLAAEINPRVPWWVD